MSRSSPASPSPLRLRILGAGVASAAVLAFAAGPAHAASCSGADAVPEQASRQAVAGATLCLLNAERTARGLPALHTRPSLAMAAKRHARDMVKRRYFAHTAPGGKGIVTRVRRAGYLRSAKRWKLGENLGWGAAAAGSPQAIVQAWMKSAPHRRAILRRSYREAGVGVVWGAPRRVSGDIATYTVDFGARHF